MSPKNSTLGLEIYIQVCRLQIQREREKLAMTPKMRGALEALKQLKSNADDTADGITKRITKETMPALLKAKVGAHGSIDSMHTIVDDIDEFVNELKNSNGGDPLDDSEMQSEKSETSHDNVSPLRSSEVASR